MTGAELAIISASGAFAVVGSVTAISVAAVKITDRVTSAVGTGAVCGYTANWTLKFEPPAQHEARTAEGAAGTRKPESRTRPLAAVTDAPDMLRTEAAALLGISDGDAQVLGKAGVLDALPYDGRAARVTKASVQRFLALRNGGTESAS